MTLESNAKLHHKFSTSYYISRLCETLSYKLARRIQTFTHWDILPKYRGGVLYVINSEYETRTVINFYGYNPYFLFDVVDHIGMIDIDLRFKYMDVHSYGHHVIWSETISSYMNISMKDYNFKVNHVIARETPVCYLKPFWSKWYLSAGKHMRNI